MKVVSITEASSYDEVRGSVRRVAEALDRPERGAAIVAAMDAKLARAQGPGAASLPSISRQAVPRQGRVR